MHQLTPNIALSVSNLSKSYGHDSERVLIFQGLGFELVKGSFTIIVGRSGSGKSTLLHILAGLERPDSGAVNFQGQDLLQQTSEELAALRLRKFGIVFQFFNLLPTLTLLENVALPAFFLGMGRSKAENTARHLLWEVGLEHRIGHFPHQVSGGEIQRAAIARALVNNPEIIFADEPSGSLDSRNANAVFDLFVKLSKNHGATLLVVTHDHVLEERAEQVIRLDPEGLSL